jgi:outer membrane protein TolC
MINRKHYIKKREMLKIITTIALLWSAQLVSAQPAYSVAALLDSIQSNNPVSRMYAADIRSMDEAARGARSWMPPEVGAGVFMAPYNTGLWKKMSDMEPGMGSFMVSVQQMIPSRRKLNADVAYMRSMSGAAREQQKAELNALYTQAKKAYYEWVILEKKKAVLNENEKVLEFMIKNAEIRYRNGLDQINAYYKARQHWAIRRTCVLCWTMKACSGALP